MISRLLILLTVYGFASFLALPSAMKKLPRQTWAKLRPEVLKLFNVTPEEQARLRILHRRFQPAIVLKSNKLQGADRMLGFNITKVQEITASGK